MIESRTRLGRLLGRLALLGGLCLMAGAPLHADEFEDEFEVKPWEEIQVQLPPFPQDKDLYSFYVSATASSEFLVDIQNLSIGSDGVVRYVLAVISPSGVRNLNYEGMRCTTRERRIYAFGRPDGQWSKAKGARWFKVQEATTNRQYAALYTDFFCPDGIIALDVEQIRRAIRKEGRPYGGSR